jgi:glucoamylase
VKVAPDFLQFLRDDAELAKVQGEMVVAESRVNPDGTLDISKWARPQHDGPPLRALALLHWAQAGVVDAEAAELIRSDLDFTAGHWHLPSFDIWEEDQGQHYYTLRVSAAALDEGAVWMAAHGDPALARQYQAEAEVILQRLDGYWLADAGHYCSRVLDGDAHSDKQLDIAVILAAIHAGGAGRRHTVHDPRMQTTLAKLDAVFHTRYSINHDRPPGRGPALGRYAADRYYGGGAWYVSTLAAAEFCFRAAPGSADAAPWIDRGDAYLATVRAFTPADGALSEQFDPATGEQTSAKHLAWSYAAFISCLAARRAVPVRP